MRAVAKAKLRLGNNNRVIAVGSTSGANRADDASDRNRTMTFRCDRFTSPKRGWRGNSRRRRESSTVNIRTTPDVIRESEASGSIKLGRTCSIFGGAAEAGGPGTY